MAEDFVYMQECSRDGGETWEPLEGQTFKHGDTFLVRTTATEDPTEVSVQLAVRPLTADDLTITGLDERGEAF